MSLPAAIDNPQALAYIAQLLAWRDGDPIPPKPVQLTIGEDELARILNDDAIRRELALRLSVLVPHPNRKLRRRRR